MDCYKNEQIYMQIMKLCCKLQENHWLNVEDDDDDDVDESKPFKIHFSVVNLNWMR